MIPTCLPTDIEYKQGLFMKLLTLEQSWQKIQEPLTSN